MAVIVVNPMSTLPSAGRRCTEKPSRIKFLPHRWTLHRRLARFLKQRPRLQMQNPIEDTP
ncbi:hypothetical protein ACGTRS_23450 [Burkholderia semiarida]|uniref:Uncharacterized protein n=1 Tax=Burkholderia semiarida TaxID=2843303 RepID=A0ABW7L7Z4_9BURK